MLLGFHMSPKILGFHTARTTLDIPDSPLSVLCAFCSGNGRFIALKRDRFGFLNKYSRFDFSDMVDEAPVLKPPSENFEQLVDKRASELCRDSCAVLWSGGIDSTLVLSALIKNGIRKDCLEIYCNSASMLEFPEFYRWLLRERFNIIRMPDGIGEEYWFEEVLKSQAVNKIIKDETILSATSPVWRYGDIGTIFYQPIESFLVSMGDVFPDYRGYPHLSADQAFEYADIYRGIANNLGFAIDNPSELSWLSRFILYGGSKVEVRNDDASNGRVVGFFDTDDFISFEVANFHLIEINSRLDPYYHKKIQKEYINRFFPCERYYRHKTKFPSARANTFYGAAPGSVDFVVSLDNSERLSYPIPESLYFNDGFMRWFMTPFEKNRVSDAGIFDNFEEFERKAAEFSQKAGSEAVKTPPVKRTKELGCW